MPELGAVGFAELVANEACPEIADGPGQVVTATFAHTSAQVLDLVFESLEGWPMDAWTADLRILASPETRQAFHSTAGHESRGSSLTLGVTAAHPFWSMTRDEFVPAGEMELGEQVVALEGQLWRLTSITSRAGPESVYNFEVAGEHVYYVGSDGLLVHNWYLNLKLSSAGNLLQLNKNARWARVPALVKKAKRLASQLHHSIPKFVGGFANGQKLVPLPNTQHKLLHDMIDKALQKRGLPGMRAGGSNFMNAASQKKALGAVAEASKKFDKAYGTTVHKTFIDEIFKGNFTRYW